MHYQIFTLHYIAWSGLTAVVLISNADGCGSLLFTQEARNYWKPNRVKILSCNALRPWLTELIFVGSLTHSDPLKRSPRNIYMPSRDPRQHQDHKFQPKCGPPIHTFLGTSPWRATANSCRDL